MYCDVVGFALLVYPPEYIIGLPIAASPNPPAFHNSFVVTIYTTKYHVPSFCTKFFAILNLLCNGYVITGAVAPRESKLNAFGFISYDTGVAEA